MIIVEELGVEDAYMVIETSFKEIQLDYKVHIDKTWQVILTLLLQ